MDSKSKEIIVALEDSRDNLCYKYFTANTKFCASCGRNEMGQPEEPLHPANSPAKRKKSTFSFSSSGVLSKSFGNFMLGFLAGVCAAFFPPLVALLTKLKAGASSEQAENLFLLSPLYLYLALAFCIIVGIVTIIFEWEKKRKPGEIFTAALGIPAILTGALGTGSGVNDFATASEALKSAQTALLRNTEIRAPVNVDKILEGAKRKSKVHGKLKSNNESYDRRLQIIPANMGLIWRTLDSTDMSSQKFLIMKEQQLDAVLVIDEANTIGEAKKLAIEYRNRIEKMRTKTKILYRYPDIVQVRILPYRDKFLVISGGKPFSIREASFLSKELGWVLNTKVSVLPLEKSSDLTAILLPKASHFSSLHDLKGSTVCVLNQRTADRLSERLNHLQINAKIESGYKDVSDAFLLYNRGYCNAVVADRALLSNLTYYLKDPQNYKIRDISIK